MGSLEELKKEVEKIQARNRRVEADKAWETSWTRRALLFGLTYIVVVIFYVVAELPNPLTNGLVSSAAFVVATSTVPHVKKWWLTKSRK